MEIIEYITKPVQHNKRAPRKTRTEDDIAKAHEAALEQKRLRYKNDEHFRILKRVQTMYKQMHEGTPLKKESTIAWYNQAVKYLNDPDNNPRPKAELVKTQNAEKVQAQIDKLQAQLKRISV